MDNLLPEQQFEIQKRLAMFENASKEQILEHYADFMVYHYSRMNTCNLIMKRDITGEVESILMQQ